MDLPSQEGPKVSPVVNHQPGALKKLFLESGTKMVLFYSDKLYYSNVESVIGESDSIFTSQI